MGRSALGSTLRWLPLLLLAYVLQTTTFRLVLLQATSAWHGTWPVVQLDKCPAPDLEAFRARLIPTPRLAVADFEECFRVGEASGNPLICELPDQTPERLEAIGNAILSDRTPYATTCREGHDAVNFVTSFHREDHTMESVLATPGNCGASFVFGEAHEEALHEAIPYIAKNFSEATNRSALNAAGSRVASSFVSNFHEARMSTASHAASVCSIAYQIAGKKVWLLHDHEESSADYLMNFPVWVPTPSCLDTFTRGLKRPFVAVTRPGDALFFPFAYQHAVYTDGGPGIMTNVRKIFKPSGDYILRRFSPASLVKFVCGLLRNGAHGNASPRRANFKSGTMQWMFAAAETRSPAEVQANADLAAMLGSLA